MDSCTCSISYSFFFNPQTSYITEKSLSRFNCIFDNDFLPLDPFLTHLNGICLHLFLNFKRDISTSDLVFSYLCQESLKLNIEATINVLSHTPIDILTKPLKLTTHTLYKPVKAYLRALGHSGRCCDRWGRSGQTSVTRAGGRVFTVDEHDGEVVGTLNNRAWHRGGGYGGHTFILRRRNVIQFIFLKL